ncbi:MAG: EF-hand domain-containing protein [Pseudolabrys sp.]
MFIPVGLALGALLTVSSLVGTAGSSLAKAGGDDPLRALAQAFTGEQPQQKPTGGKPADGPLDTGTLAALIALQGQNGAGHAGLVGKLDADGDGVVDKSELESALAPAGVDKASADAAVNTLDADGDGGISKSELKKVASGYHSHYQQHNAAGHRPLDQLTNSFRMNSSQS